MKKIWMLIGFVIFLFLLSGCQKVTCKKPYSKVGSVCCFDPDGDSVCDKPKEQLEKEEELVLKSEDPKEEESTEPKIQIQTEETELEPPYIAEEINGQYLCGECASNEKCVDGICVEVDLITENVCGNFVCEPGESFDGLLLDTRQSPVPPFLTNQRCYFDCAAPSAGYSNDYVDIKCACEEAEIIASCARKDTATYGPCYDCGEQERIFPEVAELQKETVKCLADYFSFTPPRFRYFVYNMRRDLECSSEQCTKGPGGAALNGIGVYLPGLNGYVRQGKSQVTFPDDYMVDIHETTHHFTSMMLHYVPKWFDEAVAIQTNERLECPQVEEHHFSGRESYLREADYSPGEGVSIAGFEKVINLDYWRELKKEGKPIPEEIRKSHIKGTLFVLALRDEYGCGYNCFRDIVIRLHEIEKEECMQGDDCLVQPGFDADENDNVISYIIAPSAEKKQFARIKSVVEEKVNADISWIFLLLDIDEST